MNQVNQAGVRLAFDNAYNLLMSMRDETGRQVYDLSRAKLTQSYIRGEAPLSTASGTYNIPIIDNQRLGTPRVNNQLVALQDILVVNQLSIMIGIGNADNGAARLYTYGNTTAFATSGAAAALWSIYNGKLILLNNNEQVVPAWDMLKHYNAPAIQAIADLYYDGTAIQQDELNLTSDTFYPVEPGWVINGAGKMQLQVVCPSAPAAIQADSFICAVLRGILFQNVTKVV